MADIKVYQSGDVALTYKKLEEQRELIQSLVGQTLTNVEFDLFANVCVSTNLNPLLKEIYAMKFNGRMSIVVGIAGLRLIAVRSGQYAGQEGPFWCGEDGEWRDVWLTKNPPPSAAMVRVWRRGFKHPTTGVATWQEYGVPGQAKPGGMNKWQDMPQHMLAKVAEGQALKKAFPGETAGLVIDEELAQYEDASPSPARRELNAPKKPTLEQIQKKVGVALKELHPLDEASYSDARAAASAAKDNPDDLSDVLRAIESEIVRLRQQLNDDMPI